MELPDQNLIYLFVPSLLDGFLLEEMVLKMFSSFPQRSSCLLLLGRGVSPADMRKFVDYWNFLFGDYSPNRVSYLALISSPSRISSMMDLICVEFPGSGSIASQLRLYLILVWRWNFRGRCVISFPN